MISFSFSIDTFGVQCLISDGFFLSFHSFVANADNHIENRIEQKQEKKKEKRTNIK